jgi:molecular chaperone DnaK
MAMIRLNEAVEKAKIELSSVLETDISLPFIAMKDGQPVHLQMKVTRAKLEQLVRPIVEKTAGPMEQALKDAQLTPNDIDKIILIGGPTRMPIVRDFVEQFMGKPVERGIDPMEAVAMGAAIQGGIIEGTVKDIVLVDVTPLSLGVETVGGIMTVLIPRNTPVPVTKSEIFTTATDYQTSVQVHVLQGERPLAKDNLSLGEFVLDGIPPAPRGLPQIEVTFSIDANGILNVTAKDKATGKSQQITITNSTRLSEEEIERMRKEAEMYAEEDRKKKEEIETRNQADNYVFQARKLLKENEGKLPDDIVKEITEKADNLEKALRDNEPVEQLKQLMEDVLTAMCKAGSYLYQNNPNQGPQPNGGDGGTGEGPQGDIH